jgi:hypothetical protein
VALRERATLEGKVDGLSESTATKLSSMEADLAKRDARVAAMRDDNEQQYRQVEDLKAGGLYELRVLLDP